MSGQTNVSDVCHSPRTSIAIVTTKKIIIKNHQNIKFTVLLHRPLSKKGVKLQILNILTSKNNYPMIQMITYLLFHLLLSF